MLSRTFDNLHIKTMKLKALLLLSTITVLSALISGLNTCMINGTCFLAQLEVFKADDTTFV